MTATFAFVIILVSLALVFDYINGFHDAANSIATVVSTRVLSPGLAVLWAAFFNFIAFAVFGTRVAKAIGDGVRMDLISADLRLYVLMSALLGAIIWNLITWYLGLPTSSSHALLGGYAGAGIAAFGTYHGLLKTEVWIRTIKFIVLSPLIGMLLGFSLMVAIHWIFRRATPKTVDKFFRKGQLFSAAAFSLGHGGNDAQKTMGIITSVLAAGGILAYGNKGEIPPIPLWVVLTAHAAIALGTLVRRLAHRPHDGFKDNEAEADWRFLRRDRRGDHARLCNAHRYACFNHAHNHWRHRRRRRDAPAVRGQVGCCRKNRVGLGTHHPGGGLDSCRLILDRSRDPAPLFVRWGLPPSSKAETSQMTHSRPIRLKLMAA